jgi:hypothetical protein
MKPLIDHCGSTATLSRPRSPLLMISCCRSMTGFE